MKSVYILMLFFFNEILNVIGNVDYVPTLLWTSREFQGRKNVDYLVVKKIKSDLLGSYIMEIVGEKKPVIMVFLEQNLNTEDFEWKHNDFFPFLSNLTVNSRVDYFRSVQSPCDLLEQFTTIGFKLKRLKPGEKFVANGGDLWTVEFQQEASPRSETMKKHDGIIEKVHESLVHSGKPWIAIYTARRGSNEIISDLIQHLSPWHVEEEPQERSPKVVSLYTDEFTGFTLITRGTIKLYLPSFKKLAIKTLDDYLKASAKLYSNKMDFIIWFQNYTLKFHFKKHNRDWMMEGAKLLNEKGDSLYLTPKQEILSKNKCYAKLTEFQSEGKPIVKVKLSKYKFLKLDTTESNCEKPYRFHLIFLLILSSIITATAFWDRLFQNLKHSKKSNVVRISVNELMSLRTIPYGF